MNSYSFKLIFVLLLLLFIFHLEKTQAQTFNLGVREYRFMTVNGTILQVASGEIR